MVITNGDYTGKKRCLDTHRTFKSWVMSLSLADDKWSGGKWV